MQWRDNSILENSVLFDRYRNKNLNFVLENFKIKNQRPLIISLQPKLMPFKRDIKTKHNDLVPSNFGQMQITLNNCSTALKFLTVSMSFNISGLKSSG